MNEPVEAIIPCPDYNHHEDLHPADCGIDFQLPGHKGAVLIDLTQPFHLILTEPHTTDDCPGCESNYSLAVSWWEGGGQ